jgi:2-methylcitrate dehydratase PrpD
MVTAEPTAASAFVEFVLELEAGDIPEPVRHVTRLRFLDALGLVLAAWDYPPAAAVRRVAAGPPEVQLPVEGALPASSAALVLGTLVHAQDFDDTLLASLLHVSSVVVPTVIAAGGAADASGEEALVAAAGAAEVAARLGEAAGRRFHERGFHATGVLGPLFGSTAAARLFGLGPPEATAALGLAGSLGSGLLEFLSDGSSVKRLHPGRAAEGGILAVRLAREGFGGPPTVLEGARGVYAAYVGDPPDVNVLTRDLGAAWLSEQTSFKRYPCAHVLQPFIDAALETRPAGPVGAVRVKAPALEASLFANDEPANEYQRRASLPYVVAAALVDGAVDSDTFETTTPEREELARRVRVEPGAPAFDVELAGGERVSIVVTQAHRGDPAAMVIEKFERNASLRLDDSRVERLRDAVLALEEHPLAQVIELTRRIDG